MRYRLLGKSGLRVSEMCLGTMTFGEDWGWGASKEESRQVFDAFVAAGGNFIDTAINYTNGTSEQFTGEFIASDRARFVLATKYTLSTRPEDPNASGNHRKNMVQAVEASLRRLKTDYIDLYWLHAWDYTTPVEEVMRGLDDLVRAGKILYVGVSDTPAWVVSRANMLAELRGWSPFVGLQLPYSLLERTPERELLPMARALDLSVTAWGVIGSGVLTGKYSRKRGEAANGRLDPTNIPAKHLAIADQVEGLAEEFGRSPAQIAIAWARQRGVIPILGARKLSQIEDNLASLEVHLTDEQMARLNNLSQIELGFPHDFLNQEHILRLIYGSTHAQLDNHHWQR